ncbi:MAG: hypothetical protein ACE5LH_04970 [Fidelibacterota bacterium]
MKGRIILALGLILSGIVGCSDLVDPLSSDPYREIASGSNENDSGSNENDSGSNEND